MDEIKNSEYFIVAASAVESVVGSSAECSEYAAKCG